MNLRLALMSVLSTVFVPGLFAQEQPAENHLNKRLFFSKPQLHHSPTKARLNLSAFDVVVDVPVDSRANFYGEVIYHGKKAEALEEFFESSTTVEVQHKVNADMKTFKVKANHQSPSKVNISSVLEIFYPKLRGFINGESFAKVRLDIMASLNGTAIIHDKYESLYITNGVNNNFEGDISMTVEQGENITVGMALRETLDQFYDDLNRALALGDRVLIRGTVINSKTKAPVVAAVRIMGDSTSIMNSNVKGKFDVIVLHGRYKVQITAPGFITYNHETDATSGLRIIHPLFPLQPIEKGVVVALKNVLFTMGTTQLLPDSYDELDAVVKFMNDNKRVKIELDGHTDNQGDPHKDVELSQQRVDRIKAYLVSKGVSARRITGKGFGGSKPIASNATEDGRKLNRRVEFVILKN